MRTSSVLVAVFVVFATLQPADAAPICSWTRDTSFACRAVTQSVDLGLETTPIGSDTVTATLFDSLLVTDGDEGSTFTATSATDPGFDQFVGVITDGSNGMVSVIRTFACGWASSGSSEAGVFAPVGSPDLMGYSISRIELHLDELTLDSPGDDPNGDGIWTDYSDEVTITFHGERMGDVIPEPATLSLLGFGALALVRRRRRK